MLKWQVGLQASNATMVPSVSHEHVHFVTQALSLSDAGVVLRMLGTAKYQDVGMRQSALAQSFRRIRLHVESWLTLSKIRGSGPPSPRLLQGTMPSQCLVPC